MKRWFILVTLMLLSGAHAKSLKVLFVGNSYTYVCGMPEILKAMAEAKGHTLQYEQQTPGGRTFRQHWEEKKAVEKMKKTPFDVIVFQNQSFEPVSDPANMIKYGKLLAAEADKTGARKLYYLTMAYKGPVKWMKGDSEEAKKGAALLPVMYEQLIQSYTRLADETNGDIAPVGIAWKLAYEATPSLKLHAGDQSHPAAQGAYLTALVFYAALFEEPPQDMPEKLTVQARKKGKLQPVEIQLDSETRILLEAAAQKACGKPNEVLSR
ncbi:hypothetical protein P4B35_04615 [Pontiellaceae bacterium B12227]|nr:hypothetical protein [Pontiellaceae bacterium B12227]